MHSTAVLDAQAEHELDCHFREMMQGHTLLLITYRFSTIRMADVIAVLEQGQISEYGTHEDLLVLGGTYTRLYTTQVQKYSQPSSTIQLYP